MAARLETGRRGVLGGAVALAAAGLAVARLAMMQGSKADLVLSQPDTMDVSYSAIKEEVGAELAVAIYQATSPGGSALPQ